MTPIIEEMKVANLNVRPVVRWIRMHSPGDSITSPLWVL